MTVIFGSARVDEMGNYQNGQRGDQKQKSNSNDRVGEVSMQNFYLHSKGWYVLRPKSEVVAKNIAQAMIHACNNPNIGYSQTDRADIIKKGIKTLQPTNADCSSLVRACIIAATGKDVGNFTTYNEVKVLEASGLFETRFKYVNKTVTPVKTGDVLVTCTKGHTGVITQSDMAPASNTTNYYPKYTGTSKSIVQALAYVGEHDTTYKHRQKIAAANKILNYQGTALQNTNLLTLLKKGELRKA